MRKLERHGSSLAAASGSALAALVSHDDWLPKPFAQAHPQHYQQYLLHCDPLERFSLVSFVWGPGQRTPIHDHTVWGLIGMLRGAETSQRYRWCDGVLAEDEGMSMLRPGDIDLVTPKGGRDTHRVCNAFDDRVSISLYGGNIGAIRRHVFDDNGAKKQFVSGYANEFLPNIWQTQRP